MKKLSIALVLALVCVMLVGASAFAAKPVDNLAGAQKVSWNLSADVMPVPPYGSRDIPGSDEASKLIVNQPNGDVEVVINGMMKGLNPDTEYTVYLSKGYIPYTPLDITGTYTWLVLGTYSHDLEILTQNPDGTFSGVGGYPAGIDPYATTEIITGQVIGNQVTLTTLYEGPYNPGYTVTAVGTIAADGSMSGTVPWEWHTTSGAVTLPSGSTGWPGLLTPTVQPFTFQTNAQGIGNWNLNLRDDDFQSPGTYNISIWINEAGRTMLISDTFQVVVD